MKYVQKKLKKLGYLQAIVCLMAICFATNLSGQIDTSQSAKAIERERRYQERQHRLTQQCTEKMLQLLREAPVVVEGKIIRDFLFVDSKSSPRRKYGRLKFLVSDKLKGNYTTYNDTLFFTYAGGLLDENGEVIRFDHGFSPGLYQEKPIILMLKPNDDVNSPFYNYSRKNYIAYDPVQPSIGYAIDWKDYETSNPSLYFKYPMDYSYCISVYKLKDMNKMIKDIDNLKQIKKNTGGVSLRSNPTINSIVPLETTAGTGGIITISGSGFGTQKGYIKFKNANIVPSDPNSYLTNLDSIYIKLWKDDTIKVEVPGVVYKGYEIDYSNNLPLPLAASGKIEVWTVDNGHKESNQTLNIKYAHRVYPTVDTGAMVLLKAEPIYLATRNCQNGLYVKPHIELKYRTGAITAMDTALHRWERKMGFPVRLYRDEMGNILYTYDKTENDTFKVYLSVLPTSTSGKSLMVTSTTPAPSGYIQNPNYYYRYRTYIEIDSTVNWDYSISGDVPNNKTDFLDNFCHEMGHALQLNHDVDLTHGSSYNEILQNLMHFDKQPGSDSASRPNLILHSDRGIAAAKDMRDISMTKKWNAENTLALSYSQPNEYNFLIEDHPTDNGIEPFWGPDDMWTSQAIWVRRNADGVQIHQNPNYDTNDPNDYDYVYVKTKNIGCKQIPSGKIRAFWAKASTGLIWPGDWTNNPPHTPIEGNELIDAFSTIDDVKPGRELIYAFKWKVPNPNLFPDKDHHYCLLARVSSSYLPLSPSSDSIYLWNQVPYNSQVAWKNISIIDTMDINDTTGFTIPTTVWISPIMPSSANPTTTIRVSSNHPLIFANNEVVLTLKGKLYDKWSNRTGTNAPTILGGQKIQINANNTDLVFNIGVGERYSIDVSYGANNAEVQPADLNIDLNQIEQNIIVGGERFEIRTNAITTPNNYKLLTKRDTKEKIVLVISPNPNASKNELFVYIDTKSHTAKDLSIKIVNMKRETLSSSPVLQGHNQIKTSNLTPGTYIVLLMDDRKILASQKLIIL